MEEEASGIGHKQINRDAENELGAYIYIIFYLFHTSFGAQVRCSSNAERFICRHVTPVDQ